MFPQVGRHIHSSPPRGTVTVSGGSASSTSGTGPVVTRIDIKADGTIEKYENGVVTQLSSSTDWIIPNSAANQAYQVRYTLNSGSTASVGATLSEGVWSILDQDRIVLVRRTGADGPGTTSANITIEIRYGEGSTLDSAVYTLSAQLT